MEWKDRRIEKPTQMCICLVANEKGYMHAGSLIAAIYHPDIDVFVYYNPDIRHSLALDVTHYLIVDTEV
jgi:hypothetical protein